MKVYVFGNQDLPNDNKALKVVEKLKDDFKDIEFVIVNPNEDIPFENVNFVVILDVISGISKVMLFDNIDKLVLTKSTSVHDYDLGFQLKYLKKIGKIKKVNIIGVPQGKNVDYPSIHSILRKLVAHDMQGS